MAQTPDRSRHHPGVSRRDFLSGSGAAAAATALAGTDVVTAHAGQDGTPVVRGATSITLRVNGQAQQVKVEPRTTLLEVLRTQLDLTGAKPVSGDGSSGASTVLVDGRPARARAVHLEDVGRVVDLVVVGTHQRVLRL